MPQIGPNGIKRDIGAALRAALATAATGGAASWFARLAHELAPFGHDADVTDLVAAGALALGALAAAVLALGSGLLLLVAVARSAGRSWRRAESAARRLTPAALRRAVAVGLGAGLVAGPVPAFAEEAPPALGWQVTDPQAAPSPAAVPGSVRRTATEAASTTTPSAAAALSTTPGDTATTSTATAAVPADAATAGSAPATVMVRPGDCLWSIAAAHLPGEPGVAEIAAAWPAWYDANAELIGPDPDLLRPGQVLRVPDGGAR